MCLAGAELRNVGVLWDRNEGLRVVCTVQMHDC
jgi:hypothetical protein